MQKKQRNGQHDVEMQIKYFSSYSNHLFELSGLSLQRSCMLLFMIKFLASPDIGSFPRRTKRAQLPEQLRLEGGAILFRLLKAKMSRAVMSWGN